MADDVHIDTTSTQSWASTWVAKARSWLPLYKAEHSEHDYLCDLLAGELPWTELQNDEVLRLIPLQPDFPLLLKEYHKTWKTNKLATAFSLAPNEGIQVHIAGPD